MCRAQNYGTSMLTFDFRIEHIDGLDGIFIYICSIRIFERFFFLRSSNFHAEKIKIELLDSMYFAHCDIACIRMGMNKLDAWLFLASSSILPRWLLVTAATVT